MSIFWFIYRWNGKFFAFKLDKKKFCSNKCFMPKEYNLEKALKKFVHKKLFFWLFTRHYVIEFSGRKEKRKKSLLIYSSSSLFFFWPWSTFFIRIRNSVLWVPVKRRKIEKFHVIDVWFLLLPNKIESSSDFPSLGQSLKENNRIKG